MNRIDFNKDGTYDVKPIIIHPERKKKLNDNLLMFFTGFTRLSSDMQNANQSGYKTHEDLLLEMYALVDKAEAILEDNHSELDEFGRLLDLTWKMKKTSAKTVTTDAIDSFYDRGIRAGALGGKLLGAGGGGFLLFYVQPDKRENVMNAMKDLLYVPFKFVDGGSQVIHYTAESYVPKEELI